MITDVHCHYVPDAFWRLALTRPEFAVTVKRREGEAIDLDIRGTHFGLNTTFFDMTKQAERMQRDGVQRTILSLATPFIDVLAVLGGARWFAAYGVAAAMGAVGTAFAVAITMALFRTIGARRTRLMAQIVAAVIGAAFVIGLQIAAIFSYRSLSLSPLQ